MKSFCSLLFCLSLLTPSGLKAADEFDRHTSYWLKQAAENQEPVKSLSAEEGTRLKGLSRQITSPCLVIQTNDGNWAKALVAWGYRRGTGQPVPVLLLERYVTYRGDRGDTALANGKEIMLFAGFSFNFDIGQVVPDGQGADIRFTPEGKIEPVDNAKVYALNGSQVPEPNENTPDPNDHEGVLPTDFTGTWNIDVDGRWQGELELTVEENGRTFGKYTSTESKSSYEVTGRVGAQAQQLRLELHLENATQTFEAFLWSKNKSVMAGTSTLAGRTFGFYATRVKANAEKSE